MNLFSSLSSLPSGRSRPKWLHVSRCGTSSLSLLYPSLITQSSNFYLGLPLPLLPFILLSIISLLRESVPVIKAVKCIEISPKSMEIAPQNPPECYANCVPELGILLAELYEP